MSLATLSAQSATFSKHKSAGDLVTETHMYKPGPGYDKSSLAFLTGVDVQFAPLCPLR